MYAFINTLVSITRSVYTPGMDNLWANRKNSDITSRVNMVFSAP